MTDRRHSTGGQLPDDDDDSVPFEFEPEPSTRTAISGNTPARRSTSGVLEPGDYAGSYAIERAIARGGCGMVYVGRHRQSSQLAAIKVLRPEMSQSDEMIERFIREARAVDRIRHPGIVDIYELGVLHDGRPFFVMELLEGRSLRVLARQQGALSPEETLELLTPICAALQAAHDAGYVHRDLKSSNIMVSSDGQRVTLLDFGIAKLIEPEPGQTGLTSIGHRLGTPHAMAPEQVLCADVDARTDIYALGVLCFELLCAQLPFNTKNWTELEYQHVNTAPPRLSEIAAVPLAVEAVVLRSLAKRPEERYQSASAFYEAFRRAVHPAVADDGEERGSRHRAVGILVEASMLDESDDELAEELLDSLIEVLDISEECLVEGGFEVAFQTSHTMLGVRLLSDDSSDGAAEVEAAARAQDLVDELHDTLQHEGVLQDGLGVYVRVHVEGVQVDDGSFVGGALLRISDWPHPSGSPLAS